MSFYLAKSGEIVMEADFSFHASKVQQIFENLKEGKIFTFIATNTFQHTGVGNFLFYPSVFLYPWAILKFFLNPIDAYYCWIGLITFSTFLISYFCMMKFSENTFRSLVFSYIYVLAPYRLFVSLGTHGELLTATFLPIVFLGLYNIVYGDYDKWYVLSIGLALVSYGHILSIFIIFEIFVGLLFLKFIFGNSISFKRIKFLIKSAFLTLLLVLPILIPFLTDLLGQNIIKPYRGIGLTTDPFNVFQMSINNGLGFSVGLILLVFLLTGWLFVKQPNRIYYYMGLALTIISTTIFPWHLFNNTILATVQITYRYILYASFFLSVSISGELQSITYKEFYKKFNDKSILIFGLVIMSAGFLLYCSSFSEYYSKLNSTSSEEYLKKPEGNKVPNLSYTKLDKNNYNDLFYYQVSNGERDYYPQKSFDNSESIINNISYLNGKSTKITPKYKDNKIIYRIKLKGDTVVDLPTIVYKNTYVRINHKKANFEDSSRGTVFVNLNKGLYNIEVGYKPPIIYFIGILISVLTWIYILLFYFKSR
ncbi:hypothetical protein R4B61_02855 [Fructilactobacillus vespulae]|uniref:hypothetical protein n=1 Tax=Fructilactobacillus vespulae TaxID=1249630 RepID=UPI0039B47A45